MADVEYRESGTDSRSVALHFLKNNGSKTPPDFGVQPEKIGTLSAAGSSSDDLSRLAKELLLSQLQEKSGHGSRNTLFPNLQSNSDALLKGRLEEYEKSRPEQNLRTDFEFQTGNLSLSYDKNTMSANNMKLLGTLLLEEGRVRGFGFGAIGSILLLNDADKFGSAPGFKSGLSLAADGAMVYAGAMRMGSFNPGSLTSGLGYLGLGSRLAVGDIDRTMKGDHSLKNNLALSSDATILGAGFMKVTGYGPKWFQGGLLAGALLQRAAVSLIPDRIKYLNQ